MKSRKKRIIYWTKYAKRRGLDGMERPLIDGKKKGKKGKKTEKHQSQSNRRN